MYFWISAVFIGILLSVLVEVFYTCILTPQYSPIKVVSSEKVGGSGVTSTLGTWYVGVLLSFNEAAILYRDFNSVPSQKQNLQLIIVSAANVM